MRRLLVLGGMMLGPDDLPAFTRPLASLANLRRVIRRVARYARDRLSHGRGTEISNGNALVARMFYSLRERGAEVWTDAPLVELIRQNGRVCGAVVQRNGRSVRVDARHGVVLATGGFPHDGGLRDHYAGSYPHAHSMAFTGNTGDGLKAATTIGAAVDTDLAAPGLWTPASILKGRGGKGETIIYGYLDRGRPGIIAVNPDGKRFVNESNSYHDIVMAMFEQSVAANPNFYFVCDARFVRRNGLGAIRPWPFSPSLKPFARKGYIAIADTLVELGNKIGIDGDNLAEAVRRHNEFARTGRDLDFGKGSTAYNRIWGQADAGPNPNLTPIEAPPFVALRIIPATLGTTIGLKTNGHACVLDNTGAPIPGLYACGNELASAMRGFYPGGGVTLGPAVVFAYRAVEHAAEGLKRDAA
jgi:3-oxosteroid 1-dehydrogenase